MTVYPDATCRFDTANDSTSKEANNYIKCSVTPHLERQLYVKRACHQIVMRTHKRGPLYSDDTITVIRQNWFLILLIIVTLAQLVSPIAELLGLISRTIPYKDPAVFQHGGWYITQGAIPYVDFWDVKPPLIYFLTAVLAIFSGGNMEILHILSWTSSASAVIGISLVTGLIISKLTNDGLASLVAGVTPLVLSQLYIVPRGGVYPQLFSLFFGILSIYTLLNERSFLSGIFSILATGFYYPEGIFVLLVIAIIVRDRDLEHLKYAVLGMMIAGLLILLPFIIWWDLTALFVETVLVSIFTEGSDPISTVMTVLQTLGPAIIVIPFGVVGWAKFDRFTHSEAWWIGLGSSLYTIWILFFGGVFLHIIGWVVFMSLGMGLLVAVISKNHAIIITVCVLLLISTSLLWTLIGPSGLLVKDTHNQSIANSTVEAEKPDMRKIYWGKMTPESCHYRLSKREIRWIEITNAEYSDISCGEWPKFSR